MNAGILNQVSLYQEIDNISKHIFRHSTVEICFNIY